MRAVVQRVTRASVTIEGEIAGEIGNGLVVLLGVARDDTREDADYLAAKIAALRIFDDAAGRMNVSVKDINGGVLIVSQFTLYGAARGLRGATQLRLKSPSLCTIISWRVAGSCLGGLKLAASVK
jgi:D-tyrosyl-tRNA(Tyr) deacylase